ncbi:molecular chaperone TorD [Actinobacillus succinogenes]|uniref:Chaperone protein TorD n=1 Tax=Actinobacillus succinogenes (strain ATCC 55618 / DSM 22257 / CCUG 43843 / 130Z) TaxID=339671 RepID=TORD_ACTSZ|nr:molecular chaperone TorD [Actinobacillus succinogenes]A6VMS2.1 RecName: Full=Chaperone protein TorD [Actinobacillus succinogenes 130Z]ABR74269.1 cytoplasmic chaperone TorD family protein [Actinobacillus succinogenes 130Z]PHI39304.1 molecular chaperone TorD [Actinobacillus succinogenes]
MIALEKDEKLLILNWLRNLLARELSDEQLQTLQAVEFSQFFAFLAEIGFEKQSSALQQEIQKIALFQHPRLELAADFTQCFLLEGKVSALPYASAYLDGQSLKQNLAKMDRYLEHFQLQINRQTNEPSDHLVVYLEVLIKLLEQNKTTEAKEFIQQQLLTWFPQFAAKTEKTNIRTNFYPILVKLLFAVLQNF